MGLVAEADCRLTPGRGATGDKDDRKVLHGTDQDPQADPHRSVDPQDRIYSSKITLTINVHTGHEKLIKQTTGQAGQ